MSSYLLLKHLHVTCVVLSGIGFLLRGWGVLSSAAWVREKWVRVLPHGVDTLLLGSALFMAWISGQYPLAQGWLTGKLLGLLVYIVLGSVALKRGKTQATKAVCFALALLTYAYIVTVALSRQAWWF